MKWLYLGFASLATVITGNPSVDVKKSPDNLTVQSVTKEGDMSVVKSWSRHRMKGGGEYDLTCERKSHKDISVMDCLYDEEHDESVEARFFSLDIKGRKYSALKLKGISDDSEFIGAEEKFVRIKGEVAHNLRKKKGTTLDQELKRWAKN